MGNEEQKRSKISIINGDILSDKNLTPSEKMVYARICYFELFFESPKETAEYLGLSEWAVKSAKRKLEQLGYIICVQDTGRGKQYIADINAGVENNNIRCVKKQHQVLEKTTSDVGNTNSRCLKNQYIGKNIEKNVGKKEEMDSKRQSRVFKKPSVEEVRAYCEERKNKVDAEAFVDFYESKGWLVGKTPMKDWKAAVRTWERNGYGRQTVKDEKGTLYEPKDGEDVTYQRMFDFWKKYIRVSVVQTTEQVKACKDLLADLGEEGVQRLIVALAMRSKHSFLPAELTKIKDFVGLRQNAVVVQNFYDQHWKYWQQLQKAAQEGKEVWQV